MDKFLLGKGSWAQIRNSPLKLGIDPEKILSALHMSNHTYRKLYCLDNKHEFYYEIKDAYTFGSVDDMYLLLVVKNVIVHITKGNRVDSTTSICALFKVDKIENLLITDISPHGILLKEALCKRAHSTTDCINVLQGKQRCCDEPIHVKDELLRHSVFNKEQNLGPSYTPSGWSVPKLKFPTIPGYIKSITHVDGTILEILDRDIFCPKKFYINYKTLSMLEADTWARYVHWLESADLPPELQTNILSYC